MAGGITAGPLSAHSQGPPIELLPSLPCCKVFFPWGHSIAFVLVEFHKAPVGSLLELDLRQAWKYSGKQLKGYN